MQTLLYEMKHLAEGTIVVIPEHAIDEKLDGLKEKIKIIPIQGVLHTRDLKNIQSENQHLIDKGIQLIVMLAGDTQQSDGSWSVYNEEMVDNLLKKLPSNKKTLILNGPRTGKHKVKNGSLIPNETAHRTTVDYVTQFVIKKSTGKSWKVSDFKFGEPSLWGPALKFCVENPNVILILPGESTSMISEALTLGIRPVIYTHNAMTKTSEQYVNDLVKQERAILFLAQLPATINYRQEPLALQQHEVMKRLLFILDQKSD